MDSGDPGPPSNTTDASENTAGVGVSGVGNRRWLAWDRTDFARKFARIRVDSPRSPEVPLGHVRTPDARAEPMYSGMMRPHERRAADLSLRPSVIRFGRRAPPAHAVDGGDGTGPTPLIAAMLAFVVSKFGETIDLEQGRPG